MHVFFWERSTIYHPIYTFHYQMRIQGIHLVQTKSPFNVRYSALKLILFGFAQKKNITYFRTTKSNSPALLHCCCWTLRCSSPHSEDAHSCQKLAVWWQVKKTHFWFVLSCLRPVGCMVLPSLPERLLSIFSFSNHSVVSSMLHSC